MMKYENLRKQVLDAVLEAFDLGLIKGTSGNIAVREGDIIAITPSGIAYKTMDPQDIAIIDINGKLIDGLYKPSSETPMHTAVLRARKDVNATVHTHGMFAIIMAMSTEELKPVTPPQAEFVPVRVVPFVMPGSSDLAQKVVETLGDGRSVLLKNHGMFCCGKNIKAAMAATIYTEEMAAITYYAKLINVFTPLSDNAVNKMKALIAADQAV
jgi:ribulose-5-phosphate 4-epimerase/fuculose-1-phosphate aldolase